MTGKLAAALLFVGSIAAPLAANAQSSSPAQTQRYNVYFEREISQPSGVAVALLDEIVDQIRKRPDSGIAIIGHYDTSLPAPKALSQSRANANSVAAFLKMHAIDPRRIKVTAVGSKGLSRPTGPGVAEPLNRYVEINVGAPDRPGTATGAKKTNAQADAEYAEKMQAWNREMEANDQRVRDYRQAQDAIERQKAEQAARARQAQQQYDQARADWERRAAACRAGDYSQCGP